MRAALVVLAAFAMTSCSVGNRVDVAAEAKAVRELSRRWLTAEIAKDVPAIVSFYAPDAVEMASNTPLIRGRDAIREWYKTWLLPTGISMTFATTDVSVSRSGDLAVEHGTYAFTQTGPRGSTQDVGKYVTVWKKVGGKWMVAIDTATSDRPCAAP
jgi:uncharacterized protein (TIGR02246 family)